jgi:hypothetical protein
MANNNILYNAIIAGLTGGNQNRWITFTDPNDYSDFSDAVVVFATTLDDKIAPGAFSESSANLIQSIVEGVMGNRLVVSTNPTDYDAITDAILALFTKMNDALQPVSGETSGVLITASGAFQYQGVESQQDLTVDWEPLLIDATEPDGVTVYIETETTEAPEPWMITDAMFIVHNSHAENSYNVFFRVTGSIDGETWQQVSDWTFSVVAPPGDTPYFPCFPQALPDLIPDWVPGMNIFFRAEMKTDVSGVGDVAVGQGFGNQWPMAILRSWLNYGSV